jgi:hypothetical protein
VLHRPVEPAPFLGTYLETNRSNAYRAEGCPQTFMEKIPSSPQNGRLADENTSLRLGGCFANGYHLGLPDPRTDHALALGKGLGYISMPIQVANTEILVTYVEELNA